MVHFTVYQKFTTESGHIILINSDSIKTATARAKAQDPTAKYTGIETKW